jgi:hypothetical protein
VSDTTTTPTYVAVKSRKAYKVSASAVILTPHAGTNMLLEAEDKPILDAVLYEGFTSAQLAEFSAMKDIEVIIAEDPKFKSIKMEDVKVTSSLF